MRKQSFTLFFTLLAYSSFSQSNSDPFTTPLIDTVNAANPTSVDAEIYNGQIHIDYPPTVKGNAYYLGSDWLPGSVLYRDVFYTNLLLKYDLVRDEVVVKHYNGFSSVSLFSPRAESFKIAGSTFAYLTATGLTPGFYEVLKKGPASLYARRTKFIKEGIVAGQAENEFVERTAYYLLLSGVFYPVKKQNDLLTLLREKKDVIETALKNNGLRFSDDPEATLKAVVESYNQSLR